MRRSQEPAGRFDWRLLANGYLDEMLYDRATLDTRPPLEELRARSDVTERVKGCAGREDLSSCIRPGLPLPAGRETASARE